MKGQGLTVMARIPIVWKVRAQVAARFQAHLLKSKPSDTFSEPLKNVPEEDTQASPSITTLQVPPKKMSMLSLPVPTKWPSGMVFNDGGYQGVLYVDGECVGTIASFALSTKPNPDIFIDKYTLIKTWDLPVQLSIYLTDGQKYAFIDAKYTIVKNEAKMQWEVRINNETKVTKPAFSVSGSIPITCDCELCKNPASSLSVSSSIGRLPEVSKLPGINEIVKHPFRGEEKWLLESTIISLNDDYKWSREQIADWLETLDIDLRFK
jgi:hypothetical protein